MLVALVSSAQGQTPENYDLERQRAFQLFDDHKLIDALPLLEKLAVAKPDDSAVLERLSFALAAKSIGLADAAERRKLRIRARSDVAVEETRQQQQPDANPARQHSRRRQRRQLFQS
jgi:hypothetical protein